MSATTPTSVVLDNGTSTIKAGIGGVESPSQVIPSIVGRPKHSQIHGNNAPDDYVGEAASAIRGILKISHPIRHGVIDNFDDMEKLWHHTFNSLRLTPGDDNIRAMLTEHTHTPEHVREKSCEIFFEQFDVSAYMLLPSPTLALYGAGRTCGVVVDCGGGITDILPVYDGYSMPHACEQSRLLSGTLLSDKLERMLTECNVHFTTSAQKLLVDKIKAAVCFTSLDFQEDMREPYSKAFEMPDATVIDVGAQGQRFRTPEIMFNPALIGEETSPGIAQMIKQCVYECDQDIRQDLMNSIVVTGGNSMFPNMIDRLQQSLRPLLPTNTKCTVEDLGLPVHVNEGGSISDRITPAWRGGSILASLSSFEQMWCRRDSIQKTAEHPGLVGYDELGSRIVQSCGL